MSVKYYCPKCTEELVFSVHSNFFLCKPCNFQRREFELKKEQSFLDQYSINKDDLYLNNLKIRIEAFKNYSLDSFYLSTSNAKKDLEKKHNYILELIEDVKKLGDNVKSSRLYVNNSRALIFKKLYEISYVLLNDVYGAYNVKSTPRIIYDILSYNDINELAKYLNKSIDLIDVDSTLNYQVKPKVLSKNEIRYQNQKVKELTKSFDRISDNSFKMLSTNDVNKKAELQDELISDGVMVVLDVGVNLVANAFNSITNSISNRIDILNKIRQTDNDLNIYMKDLLNSFQSLDNELRKLNKILNVNNNTLKVLEYSFLNLKENVFSKLENNVIFKEFKTLKEPFEKNKLFTDISSQIEKQKLFINENFLKFTFKSKKQIFDSLWNAKIHWFFSNQNNTLINDGDEFKKLQISISNEIKCMKDIYKIKGDNDRVFIELDDKIRCILNNDNVYKEVQNEVWLYVDKVFFNIKNKII